MVFWTVLLTGFYLLLRKSNLVPNTQNTFNPTKQLKTEQVTITNNYVQIVITWSKTIQFHQRRIKQKMFRLRNHALCPVQAFRTLFRKLKPKIAGPVFICADGKPYSYNMLQHDLKKYLKLVGINKSHRFSAHSLRRGGLAWGYKIGLNKKYLKSLRDWRSECYQVYLSFPKEVRERASLSFKNSLKEL